VGRHRSRHQARWAGSGNALSVCLSVRPRTVLGALPAGPATEEIHRHTHTTMLSSSVRPAHLPSLCLSSILCPGPSSTTTATEAPMELLELRNSAALRSSTIGSCSQNGHSSSRGGCPNRWHSLVNCDHGDSTTSRFDSPGSAPSTAPAPPPRGNPSRCHLPRRRRVRGGRPSRPTARSARPKPLVPRSCR
jgi:hypothetical protein